MKFTQLNIAKYSTKNRIGYTLYVLGEDGLVYKSAFNGTIHCGWIALKTEILPPDWELTTWEARKRHAKTTPADQSTAPESPLRDLAGAKP